MRATGALRVLLDAVSHNENLDVIIQLQEPLEEIK